MPVINYITISELCLLNSVDDADVNKYYQIIRKLYPLFFLRQFFITSSTGFFRRRKITVRYSIYAVLPNADIHLLMLPTRIITKENVLCFFFGLMNGKSQNVKK